LLIIAIPKSASTSLLKTLGKIHNLKTIQSNKFQNNAKPDGTIVLHKYHTDVRRIGKQNIDKFNNSEIIYKQHIYPSENNQLLLKSVKKVVLLRDPKEVILAYRRGIKKKVHNNVEGFSEGMSENEWLKGADNIGLTSDLNNFFNLWKKNRDEFTLIVHYDRLISNPTNEINRIEDFFNLRRTDYKVKLSKKRYTRQSKVKIAISNMTLKFKRFIVGLLNP